ncbi:hypothetical protein THAOC_29122 [Thalassiosira oceanica]|uniref:Uncharacterized protein n=1 Tax=Thalassiosira oceanica TaxID=159749 RepID=K0RDC4_THAOC|nr:hypothetical protein THAOC_29122 [Thalassiosira oceanica]|eukprot:EJK51683.1 hypothetical protein THAOC_29122 [Thalassiosira oceanica]
MWEWRRAGDDATLDANHWLGPLGPDEFINGDIRQLAATVPLPGPTRRLSHLAAALAAWLKSEDSDSSSDEDATDHDGDDDSFVPGPTIGSRASVWPFSTYVFDDRTDRT